MSELERLARKHELGAASFVGIGAFEELVLGYFDRERKEYEEIPVDGQSLAEAPAELRERHATRTRAWR